MKAVILAGGYGKRLWPLTKITCKPMLPIKGKPMAEYAVLSLKKAGIEEIYFATGYKSSDISTYFGDGSRYGQKFLYRAESAPLGTAGAVRELKNVLGSKFLVLPGDGISDVDLAEFINTDFEGYLGVLAVCYKSDAKGLGVVKFDGSDVVSSFVEKPCISTEAYVNTGIYMFSSSIFDYITDGFCDFGNDVFPKLSGKLKVYKHRGFWSDLGTFEALDAAEKSDDIHLDF